MLKINTQFGSVYLNPKYIMRVDVRGETTSEIYTETISYVVEQSAKEICEEIVRSSRMMSGG